jgi:hypothetical protein
MSAPTRVSRNGEIDCLTDTADEPFGVWFDDHDAPALPVVFGAAGCFGAAPKGEASALSTLQSSLLTSISFMMSGSLASGAGVAAFGCSSAGQTDVGALCAAAVKIDATPKPTTSAGSLVQPYRVLEIITRPRIPIAENASALVQN